MEVGHHIESYRIWDVISLWGRETLQHEIILARVIAKAVIRDGLRVQSVDPRWKMRGTFELHGAPFVGYVARDGALPIFIRTSALKHLINVVEHAAIPDQHALFDECVTRQDFKAWLEQAEIPLPAFWFSAAAQNRGDVLVPAAQQNTLN
ncbi:MAG: hypothetical protein ABI583_09300 [Betaproteobacteria bacterium]